MDTWKLFLEIGLGYLRAAGQAKKDEDKNETGKDDAQGIAMQFGADIVKALLLGKPLPKVPAGYKAGETVGKV